MIDLQVIVGVVLYIVIAGAVFGLLFFLVDYIAKQFPSEVMVLFAKVAKIILIVLAVLVVIGILVGLVGGKPMFRWGPTAVVT